MDNTPKIKGFTDVLRKFAWLSAACLILIGGLVYFSVKSKQTQETVVLEAKKTLPVIEANSIVFQQQLPAINREAELIGDMLAQAYSDLRNHNRESALQTLAKAKACAVEYFEKKLPETKLEKKTSLISKIEQIEYDIRHEKIKEASQELHLVLIQIDNDR